MLDNGSTNSLIHSRCLRPLTITPFFEEDEHIITTASGLFDTTITVLLHNLCIPEFANHLYIVSTKAHIFDAPCRYDFILGREFIRHIGTSFCFATEATK